MRFGLKPARGGHHLNVLSMNEPLEVRRIIGSMRAGVRKPDLLIGGPEGRIVAVEYLGRHHDEPARLVQDANRTNELKAIGVSEYCDSGASSTPTSTTWTALRTPSAASWACRALGSLPTSASGAGCGARSSSRSSSASTGRTGNGRARERLRAAGAPEPAEADGWDAVPLSAYGLG